MDLDLVRPVGLRVLLPRLDYCGEHGLFVGGMWLRKPSTSLHEWMEVLTALRSSKSRTLFWRLPTASSYSRDHGVPSRVYLHRLIHATTALPREGDVCTLVKEPTVRTTWKHVVLCPGLSRKDVMRAGSASYNVHLSRPEIPVGVFLSQ